jgi:hypothetical protein
LSSLRFRDVRREFCLVTVVEEADCQLFCPACGCDLITPGPSVFPTPWIWTLEAGDLADVVELFTSRDHLSEHVEEHSALEIDVEYELVAVDCTVAVDAITRGFVLDLETLVDLGLDD